MARNSHDVLSLKNSNRALILNCIRRAPISRIDISRQTGLSKSAVTMLTGEMMEEGLLCEAGPDENSGGLGRTSVLLDLVASHGFAVGVALHRRSVGVCLTDLKMQRISQQEKPTVSFENADAVIDWVERTVRAELTRHQLSCADCVGIGVSSPGPLDYKAGVILDPPGLSLFDQYPVAHNLQRRFSCPVYLENNAVTLSLLDFYRGGRQHGNILFVVIADGIGSTLLMNGRVFRGAQGFAGELGHMSVNPNGAKCPCGNRGCLEQYAMLSSLRLRFPFRRYEDMVDGVQAGDPVAQKAFDQLVSYLGTALVNSVNLYDLDAVVLYGEYSYQSELLTRRLEQFIYQRSLVCRVHPVSVLASVLRSSDAVTAAAISPLNAFFAQNRQTE